MTGPAYGRETCGARGGSAVWLGLGLLMKEMLGI
jgi:hypothetical protein